MAGNLTRHSVGLTPAHVELIKLLAAIAVEDYLREIELGEVVHTTDELHEDQR